ncbi:membrane protein YfhO [Dysgonomonas alginatilytica]|uniref:Membrane protein YfhO n=1 Tax=Dysgonomonas alginatilytica TaxID=1605892 RepID=A0A2V3PNV0_9BACT|nr:YfhO family protein [Dysgonomonas alginatilytica]PXV62867.1 membrane protein YfhO [Dysgonomonas alginatilytica]
MIQEEKSVLKKLLQHVIAIVCFLAVTLVYFSPVLDGKVLQQSDVQQYKGMSRELAQYYEKEGQSSAWTGSMFSGMPAYQIGIWGGAPNFLDYLEAPLKALGNSTSGPVFAGMLMAYILFCVMGVGFFPAVLGAIAYSLSSYNIIIIDAGHVTKAWAIAYMPLIVAGLAAAFRRKYLMAGLFMALGLALQIKNNHLQVTYYTGLLCVFIYLGLLINEIPKKNFSGLFKATAALVVGVAIAVLCNFGNIYANYEMSKESTRGQSELTQPTQSEKQSSGLDKEYAFAWSYGKMETLSLLIPDIHGGASGGILSPSSNLYKAIRTNAPQAQVDSAGIQAQTYWGDQPFTSGPVYFGAIICFLFVLGIFVIRHPMKWVLLVATTFFIFLSWGHNFELFNDWFFYHFPMYNKFRAVSTALVIPALTMLIVAAWGMKAFFSGEIKDEKLKRSLYISAGITGGISFLLWLAPGIFGFDFTSATDSQWISQVPDWYYSALVADRKDLLSSDALRSLIYIILAAGTLYAALKLKGDRNKITVYCSVVLILLVVIDLWGVDKRYLNNDKFQSKLSYDANRPFPQTEADKAILQDKHPSYRVLNLNNPFNETKTSYYHKSIGGYHAAKLKRYQELIDYRLQGEINSIIKSFDSQNIDSIIGSLQKNTALNMLNAKYIIFHPEQAPLQNPYAMGNVWFVNNYIFTENADKEIAALNTLDITTTAVVDKRFEDQLSGFTVVPDSTATIELTEYKPNALKYKSSAQSEQLAIMSEMYYPNGWEAYIDGKPATHFRADWTLRAIRIPAGQHEIEFKFEPHAYNTARAIASASSGLLILLLIGGIGSLFYKRKDKQSKA